MQTENLRRRHRAGKAEYLQSETIKLSNQKEFTMFRSMRRFRQQLSDEECVKILQEGRRGVLALQGDDGYPYAVPINFYYDKSRNRIYYHGAFEGHKIDSLGRSDKVTFNVLSTGWRDEGQWWLQFNSVTVFGRLRIVRDPALIEEALRGIAMKYIPDKVFAEQHVQDSKDHICILELEPEHMTGKHVNEK